MEQLTKNGIDVITLFVDDLDTTKQFYINVLALELIFEDPNSAVFKLGNLLINLLK